MTETIVPKQMFDTPSEALAHYGVKGMHWGVRKADGSAGGLDRPEGVSRKVNRNAADDAAEFARAKMFYGKGAGTRRKLIKAKVQAKMDKDPTYKKAFEHHLAKQDFEKHASKAKTERRRKDATETTTKTIKGAHRQLSNGFGSVSLASAILAGAVVAARKTGIDKVLKDAAQTKYQDGRQKYKNRSGIDDMLRNL